VKNNPKRKIKPKHFDNFDFESVNNAVITGNIFKMMVQLCVFKLLVC
jgi:hypothetical protein